MVGVNKFWVGGTDTWNSTANLKWSLTSGGAGGAAVPATGDTVIFDANSGGGTCTKAATSIICGGINMTGSTTTINWNGQAQTFDAVQGTAGSGDVTLVGAKCTGTTGVWTFSGAIDQTFISNGFAGITSITRGGASGTTQRLILGDDLSITSTLQLNRAGLDMNNKNFSPTGFTTGAGAITRFLTMGSGTLSTGTIGFTFGTTAGCTLNANTAQLVCTNSQTIAIGAGFTLPPVTLQTGIGGGAFTVDCASTFPSVKALAITLGATLSVSLKQALTVSGNLEMYTQFLNSQMALKSDTGGVARTLTVNGAAILHHTQVTDITAAGTTPFIGRWGSLDGGNNTNVVLGGPQAHSDSFISVS